MSATTNRVAVADPTRTPARGCAMGFETRKDRFRREDVEPSDRRRLRPRGGAAARNGDFGWLSAARREIATRCRPDADDPSRRTGDPAGRARLRMGLRTSNRRRRDGDGEDRGEMEDARNARLPRAPVVAPWESPRRPTPVRLVPAVLRVRPARLRPGGFLGGSGPSAARILSKNVARRQTFVNVHKRKRRPGGSPPRGRANAWGVSVLVPAPRRESASGEPPPTFPTR